MKRGEARNLIYQALGDMLSGTDFRFKRSAEGYVRPIPRGQQDIGVPFYDYHPRFEFSLVMTLRLDDVEDITFMFSGALPQYRSEAVTVGIRLEYFAPELSGDFKIWSENDILEAAAVLRPIVRERIVPFLNEHQDVRSIDSALHSGAKQLDHMLHPSRGMKAVTIAKLAGNPDFDGLAEKYLSEMASIPTSDREKFVRLVDYLRSGNV